MFTKDALILVLTARDQGVQEELSRLREYAKQHAPVVIEGVDRRYPTHPVFGLCADGSTSQFFSGFQLRVFSGFQLREFGDLLIEEYCWYPNVQDMSCWETISEIHIIHTPERVRFEIYALESEQSQLLITIDISSTRVECQQHKASRLPSGRRLHQVIEHPCISELNLAPRLQAWLESVELDCKFIHKHIN